MSHTILLGRISSGSCRRKRMTHSIKQVHAAQHQQNSFSHGKQQIYSPKPLCHDTDFRMNLVMRHSRSLSRKQDLISNPENRQNSYGKKDNSQSTYPLRKATPEQHSIRKRLNIIKNSGPVVVNPDIVSKKASLTEGISPLR